jgi:hypothetical protein
MSPESNKPQNDAGPTGAVSGGAVPVGAVSGGTVFARVVVIAVVGVLAAMLAHFAISRTADVFHLPPEMTGLGGGNVPGADDQARLIAAQRVLFYKHTALWLGSTGAILGALFGLVLGVFRRSAAAVWRGTIGGMLLGGLFGAAAGPSAIRVERWLNSQLASHESHLPDYQLIVLQAATWLVIGAGVGIGVGLGAPAKRFREAARSMLLCAIAGAVGSTLYLTLAGILLPLADTTILMPNGAAEWLLWLVLPAAFMGLALGRKG